VSEQVYVDDGGNRVVLSAQERVTDDDSRVVDEHVHRAQVEFHLDGQRGRFGADGHVYSISLGRRTRHLRLDQLDRFFVARLVHVDARHFGAEMGEH